MRKAREKNSRVEWSPSYFLQLRQTEASGQALDHGYHVALSEHNLSRGSRTQQALDSSHSWERQHILETQTLKRNKKQEGPETVTLKALHYTSHKLPQKPAATNYLV